MRMGLPLEFLKNLNVLLYGIAMGVAHPLRYTIPSDRNESVMESDGRTQRCFMVAANRYDFEAAPCKANPIVENYREIKM